mgnify:FL=1
MRPFSMLVTFFPDKSYICSSFCGLIVMLSTPVVGKSIRLKGKYRTTREAITKSTINAIKLLILRSFQRKGLCNSSLKAKSTTFAYNNKEQHV